MNTPRAGWTDPVGPTRPPLIRSATIEAGRRDAVAALAQALGQGPFALVILFISPLADMAALIAGLDAVFPDTPVMGCTTAGEIGRDGRHFRRIERQRALQAQQSIEDEKTADMEQQHGDRVGQPVLLALGVGVGLGAMLG